MCGYLFKFGFIYACFHLLLVGLFDLCYDLFIAFDDLIVTGMFNMFGFMILLFDLVSNYVCLVCWHCLFVDFLTCCCFVMCCWLPLRIALSLVYPECVGHLTWVSLAVSFSLCLLIYCLVCFDLMLLLFFL